MKARDIVIRLGDKGDCFDQHDVVETMFFVVARHLHKRNLLARSVAEDDAKWMLPELIKAGYVEMVQVEGEAYRLTEKGKELARAKFVKRIPREKAIEQLWAFLDRVGSINAGQYASVVKDVWLYGSLITDAADVGDVDLICLLEHRGGHCGYDSYVEHSIARANASGQVLDYYGKLRFGSKEVFTVLKDRRAYLSINAFDPAQLDDIAGGYVQIVENGNVLTEAVPSRSSSTAVE